MRLSFSQGHDPLRIFAVVSRSLVDGKKQTLYFVRLWLVEGDSSTAHLSGSR
jgi:hypothetical protein